MVQENRFIRAGLLNKQITLQARGTTKDSFGGQTPTWVSGATVWAKIRALSGRELFAAQAVQSEVTHEIEIRYRSEVVAKMRILFGARAFDIQSVVDPDEMKRKLIISASEGLTEG